jgi:hypothetical protein
VCVYVRVVLKKRLIAVFSLVVIILKIFSKIKYFFVVGEAVP